MTYTDSNGVRLKDGDCVLSTGDGIATFAKPDIPSNEEIRR